MRPSRRRQKGLLDMNMKEMQISKYLNETLQAPSVQLTLIFSCFSIRLSSLCQTTVGRGLPWAPQLRVSESPSRTSTKVGGVFMNMGGAKSKESTQHWLTGIYMSQEMRTQTYNWTAVELLNEEMLPCLLCLNFTKLQWTNISERASANIIKTNTRMFCWISLFGRLRAEY